nr:WRKY53 [Lonicera caerulea]
MDTICNWEHKALVSELSQGMELTKQLRFHLGSASSYETQEMLLQGILSSYDKAMLILNLSSSASQQPQLVGTAAGFPESSVSANASPRSTEFDKGFKDQQEQKDVSKKRKLLPAWTEQVKVCSENGMEGPNDDGYSWRKYGQKDILGATYPRSYYRCTYRNVQNCWATKQVQRLDDDPTVFEITYRGAHTCSQASHLVPPPASPEKQETKHNHHNQQTNEALFNFRANLRVNTEESNYKEMESPFSFPSASFDENQFNPFTTLTNDDLLGGYSPAFVSPATSGSNYFSATNSPVVNLDFSIDQVDLDQNFPFDTPGFFNSSKTL